MNAEKVEEQIKLRNNAFLVFADKIVTLCAASLTLTITFRKSIVDDDSHCAWLLAVAWVCFSCAVLFGTLIHLSSLIFHGKMAAAFASDDTSHFNAGWIFPVCFFVTSLGFIFGISAFSAFAIINANYAN